MNRLTMTVYKYCIDRGLLHDGMRIIAGISGGADSVCLLRMLKEMEEVISLSIIAVHFEHGIRGDESLRDMEFVKELCGELGVPLKIYREDVPGRARELSMTVEEAGRYLRYQAFGRELEAAGADAIAVAHHLNDQAETVLFNMARGSGLKGMSGMAPARDKVIRPLLTVTRAYIEEYLNNIGQTYCNDSTNGDTGYSRNGIRSVVIPGLERITKGAAEHIARAAAELREADEYIGNAADRLYGKAAAGGRIIINVLKEEPPIIQRYVVRRVLTETYSTHKDLEAVHVEDILKLCDKQSGRSVSLPAGVMARREGDYIVLENYNRGRDSSVILRKAEEGSGVYIRLTENGIIGVPGYGEFKTRITEYDKTSEIPKEPYTKWFDYDKIGSDVFIRKRQSGDYLTIDPGERRKLLKKYLIDEKIPLSERNSLILLADGAHIIWIPGYRISSHYKVGDETRRIYEVTFRPFDGG